MFNEKVIMARLQKGEDAQAIANEFADMLNKVNKEHLEAEAAKAEADKLQKEEVNSLETILESCRNWCEKYYGVEDALGEEIFGLGSAEELVAELDKIHNMATKTKVKVLNADESIAEFLRLMKW